MTFARSVGEGGGMPSRTPSSSRILQRHRATNTREKNRVTRMLRGGQDDE
ncbi:BQ5605_C052g12581 [Microbotryum silenes-dioicae]|uniref:BQ5605_C052g12581 protein n=1 Tax=Microbotryum silenes-dioicae TaxID=796604 RepID=A0A2X0MSC1_9BASI|nr:BQ5605_C052g12581 [Microbotryum silenes-dioicae]